MDDEEEAAQPSGVLSPRRIEAIHIAFTKVFDTACKQGIIRDSSTYRSFDDVFDQAMKGRLGGDVGSETEEPRTVQPRGGDVDGEAMDIVEVTTGVGEIGIQDVVNSEVVRDEEMSSSGDQNGNSEATRSLQHAKRKRCQQDFHMDRIESPLAPNPV